MPKTQGKNLRLYASVAAATNSIRSKFEAVALDATCEANEVRFPIVSSQEHQVISPRASDLGV